MKKAVIGIAGLVLIAIIVIIRFNLFEKPVARHNRIVVNVQRPGFFYPFVDSIDTYVLNIDKPGEIYEKLPTGLGDDARWSPDGQWIIYSKFRGIVDHTEISDIYLMRFDGGHQTRLTDNKAGGSYNPTWSPDGKEIAYSSNYPDRIFILNVECILNGEKCSPTPRFLIGGNSPDWSPDGKFIVYEIFGDGIFKISADGTGKPIELTPMDVKICLTQYGHLMEQELQLIAIRSKVMVSKSSS